MRVLDILVAFECYAKVRDALIKRGHNAISCDLLPSVNGGPHIQGNAFEAMYGRHWDMMIAFYPCTRLAVSGARWFYEYRAEQFKAIQEARQVMNAPIEKISFENPKGVLSTHIRKPDQIIQPWYFGHKETKETHLWLKDLPPLMSTNIVGPPPEDKEQLKAEGWDRIHKMPPGPDRGMLRSITYDGVADAMAEQWT